MSISRETLEQQRATALQDEAAFNAAYGVASEGEAVCKVCGKTKPHAEFPYFSTAILKCAPCLKDEHAAASHEGRETAFDRGAKMLAKRMEQIIDGKKPLTHAPHITEYLDELVKQMGGTPIVVSRWLKQLQIAEENPAKQGSKTVLDQYQFIGKLILYSTEHRATAPDVTTLSDQQLLAEQQRLQMQIVLEQILDAVNPEHRKVIEQAVLKIAPSPEEVEAA